MLLHLSIDWWQWSWPNIVVKSSFIMYAYMCVILRASIIIIIIIAITITMIISGIIINRCIVNFMTRYHVHSFASEAWCVCFIWKITWSFVHIRLTWLQSFRFIFSFLWHENAEEKKRTRNNLLKRHECFLNAVEQSICAESPPPACVFIVHCAILSLAHEIEIVSKAGSLQTKKEIHVYCLQFRSGRYRAKKRVKAIITAF